MAAALYLPQCSVQLTEASPKCFHINGQWGNYKEVLAHTLFFPSLLGFKGHLFDIYWLCWSWKKALRCRALWIIWENWGKEPLSVLLSGGQYLCRPMWTSGSWQVVFVLQPLTANINLVTVLQCGRANANKPGSELRRCLFLSDHIHSALAVQINDLKVLHATFWTIVTCSNSYIKSQHTPRIHSSRLQVKFQWMRHYFSFLYYWLVQALWKLA